MGADAIHYTAQFSSAEVTFLATLADHAWTDGQLIIGNSLTGGVSFNTLVAGTNITITNGHGMITIASSGGGGGGFTALTTASAVNSINQAFVFSTASAQPSYVVVDGAWLVAVDNNSVTQWTWNSGTKTVTLIGPGPNNSIFAVV